MRCSKYFACDYMENMIFAQLNKSASLIEIDMDTNQYPQFLSHIPIAYSTIIHAFVSNGKN